MNRQRTDGPAVRALALPPSHMRKHGTLSARGAALMQTFYTSQLYGHNPYLKDAVMAKRFKLVTVSVPVALRDRLATHNNRSELARAAFYKAQETVRASRRARGSRPGVEGGYCTTSFFVAPAFHRFTRVLAAQGTLSAWAEHVLTQALDEIECVSTLQVAA